MKREEGFLLSEIINLSSCLERLGNEYCFCCSALLFTVFYYVSMSLFLLE